MAFGVRLLVSGEFACFTRPEMKVERVSYDVMTPSAARGVLEAIYWTPAVRWQISAIHILKPIRFQSIRRNEVAHKISSRAIRHAMRIRSIESLVLDPSVDRQQRASLVLVDVSYIIDAFITTSALSNVEFQISKHLAIFRRRARKGQCFHQPYLGMREFPARFTLIEKDEFAPRSIPDSEDLGIMLYDVDHDNGRQSVWFHAKLVHGIVHIPGSCWP